MDIDSAYFAISGECLRDVVKPELLDEYDKELHKWLANDAYSKRTPWLFKLEFIGSKMIALTSKCYFAEGKKRTKYSCKGIVKSQNDMTWNLYMKALQDCCDMVKNTGFRVYNKGVATCE